VQYVFLIDANSGAIRRIAVPKDGFGISSVAWSGRGDEFVYSVAESVAGGFGNSGSPGWIMAQNARTGVSRRIFWSPYGASVFAIAGPGRLVFDTRSRRENLREFKIGQPAGSTPVRWLTRGNSNDRQPAYSPDGQRVIFSSNGSGTLDLWELSTHNGMLRRLTDHPAEDWDPAYMPDGKRIIWSSNRGGNFEIRMANADGSGARQITRDGVDAENPTATPDGNWILYSSTNPDKPGLWKIRSDGSKASRLIAGRILLPETSPHGRFVSPSGRTSFLSRPRCGLWALRTALHSPLWFGCLFAIQMRADRWEDHAGCRMDGPSPSLAKTRTGSTASSFRSLSPARTHPPRAGRCAVSIRMPRPNPSVFGPVIHA